MSGILFTSDDQIIDRILLAGYLPKTLQITHGVSASTTKIVMWGWSNLTGGNP